MSAIAGPLVAGVLVSGSIPAHDETLDLAQEVGERLDALHAYVASVRSPEQADAALVEFALILGEVAATRASANNSGS